MRERLLTLIGTQRTFLLERRNELQQLQQQVATLSGSPLISEPVTVEAQPRRSFIISRPRQESIHRDIPIIMRGVGPLAPDGQQSRGSFSVSGPVQMDLGQPYMFDLHDDLARLMLMNPNDRGDSNPNYTTSTSNGLERNPYENLRTTIIASSRRSSDGEYTNTTRDLEAHFAQWRHRTLH